MLFKYIYIIIPLQKQNKGYKNGRDSKNEKPSANSLLFITLDMRNPNAKNTKLRDKSSKV